MSLDYFLLLSAFDFEQLPELVQIDAAFFFQFCLPTFELSCRGKKQNHTIIFHTTSDPTLADNSCVSDFIRGKKQKN